MEKISIMEYVKEKVKKYLSKFDGRVFAFTFIAAVMVHLFVFIHKFINHDDLDGLYSNCDFALASGRWLLSFITSLTGNVSHPWLHGMASSFYLAVSGMLMVKMLRIKHLVPACLLTLCMVAFPAVSATYAYMFCSSQYFFAMMLAVIGAIAIQKAKPLTMGLGVILIAFSMGCYQAYFNLAVALLFLSIFLDLLENVDETWKSAVVKGIKYVASLGLGMLLYVGILHVCLHMTGVTLTDYQGISTMGQLGFGELLERIWESYRYFFGFYLKKDYMFYHNDFSIMFTVVSLVVFLVTVGTVIVKKIYKKAGHMILLVLLAALIPLACNSVYLMTDAPNVHLLMVFPLVLPFVMPALVLDRLKLRILNGKIQNKLMVLLSVLLVALQVWNIFIFVITTNRAYFHMYMTYENTYAYSVKLVTKIEMQPGYNPEKQVALIGEANMNTTLGSTNMMGMLSGNEALHIYCYTYFLHRYLATEYIYAPLEVKEQIQTTEEFATMPCYPAEGSIREIDGVITVKFSEPPEQE